MAKSQTKGKTPTEIREMFEVRGGGDLIKQWTREEILLDLLLEIREKLA